MANNALVTIILAFSLTLAVISGALALVYFFYRAQRTAFLGDAESPPLTGHRSPCHNKPLPPTPPNCPVVELADPAHRVSPAEEPRPSILERRKCTPHASRPPPRQLTLAKPRPVPPPPPPSQPAMPAEPSEQVVQLGADPEVVSSASLPGVRPQRLSRQQIAKMREITPRPSMREHPIYESDGEPEYTTSQEGNLNDNKF